ncbi:MFS transporter [Salinigranum salinum]|uniref:MFS transporter n=1 Tax=Salinigranum salinum TaxID=1364937 RepID=UPI00195A4F50|nr:MFS transporter [Salinigranum salinum]
MNRNDRSIVALVSLAHGMVHTYELSIPIFVSIWLVEFSAVDLGFTQVGVTAATLGVIVTAGYGLFGAGSLPSGVLVDRVGSRRLIRACLFGMGASFLLLAVAPGLVAVTLALLVWGAAASVYHPAGLALLSKGVEERGTGFAYHGIAGNVGQGGGPLVTTLLLLFFDWSLVAALLAVPALVAGVYASRAEFDETAAVDTVTSTDGGERSDGARSSSEVESDGGERSDGARSSSEVESDGGERSDGARSSSEVESDGGERLDGSRSSSETTSDSGSKASSGVDSFAEFRAESTRLFAGGFVLVFVVALCSGLYYRGFLTFLPGVLESIPGFEPFPLSAILPADVARAIGGGSQLIRPERYFYASLLVVGVFGQYAGGKLSDRIRVEKGIVVGFGMLALLAVAFIPVAGVGVGPLAVLGALVGFFLFFVQPFYQTAVAEYTPAGARGLSYGYTYLGVFGIGALGGAIAGVVLTYAAPAELFLVLAGIGITASGLGLYLVRNTDERVRAG